MPTQEELKEFLEWCGFEFVEREYEYDSWVKGTDEFIPGVDELDLNNLFKYAMPKALKVLQENSSRIAPPLQISEDTAFRELVELWLSKNPIQFGFETTLYQAIRQLLPNSGDWTKEPQMQGIKEEDKIKIDYWSPGNKFFVSITSTRSRPITSVTSTRCQMVSSWEEAFTVVREFLQNNRFSADTITIFTKPRLCKECMKHATQPMIFDYAEHIEECLCILQGTPCGIH